MSGRWRTQWHIPCDARPSSGAYTRPDPRSSPRSTPTPMRHRTLDVTHDLRIDHALHRTLQQSAERAPILRSAGHVPSSTSRHSVPPPPLCASLECRASTLLSMRLSARSEVRSRARSSGQVEWSMQCTVARKVQITLVRATECQIECMVPRKVDCLVEWPVERPSTAVFGTDLQSREWRHNTGTHRGDPSLLGEGTLQAWECRTAWHDLR